MSTNKSHEMPKLFMPCVIVCVYNPSTQELRQEDYKFEAKMCYICLFCGTFVLVMQRCVAFFYIAFV